MNITDVMSKMLQPDTISLLKEISATAANIGMRTYLVGGTIRDLLLEKEVLDVDLVVEGDAKKLANECAQSLGGTVKGQSQFRTSKIDVRKHVIDIATARSETYTRPGALPIITPGNIDNDLLRRDFTINSMAVDLSRESWGNLRDPSSGIRDLNLRIIRVLHTDSFRDDATRIIRAIRYEKRLGFKLEKGTQKLLEQNTSYLARISSDRLRREIYRTLEEKNPFGALLRSTELGVLDAIYPPLSRVTHLRTAFNAILSQNKHSPATYLALLAWILSPEETTGLIRRLKLTSRQSKVVQDTQTIKGILPDLASSSLSPSRLYEMLSQVMPEAIQAVESASISPIARKRLQRFSEKLRFVKPFLSGNNLLKLGVPNGPDIGKLLTHLFHARLDGAIKTLDQEIKIVRDYVEENSS